MKLDHIFFVYMAVVGFAAAVILTVAPQTGDFFIKPYFWVLIGLAIFDLACYLRGQGVPGTMIGMDARLLGLVIGVVAMVALKTITGTPASVF
jgi:hypothetical protein